MCKTRKLVLKSISNICRKLGLYTRADLRNKKCCLGFSDFVGIWICTRKIQNPFLRLEIYTRPWLHLRYLFNQLFIHEEAKSWANTKDYLLNSAFPSQVSVARSFSRTRMPKTWNIWKNKTRVCHKNNKRD